MKKLTLILFFVLNSLALTQNFTVFDLDTTSFPTVRAKFWAFDVNGNQVINLSPNDFVIKENGVIRTITNVNCPTKKPVKKVSVAMSLDVSGSMAGSEFLEIPVELGKTTAKELVQLIMMPPSEFALQTCNDNSVIIQDFTTEKSNILNGIEPLHAQGNNDFVNHLLNPLAGLLNIAKTGKNKRVAVIYTDALWYALTNKELQMCKDTCLKYDIQFFAVIYSRPETKNNGIKLSLKLLAEATGGDIYEGITSKEAAINIASRVQTIAQGGEACSIEWLSNVILCDSDLVNVSVKNIPFDIESKLSFVYPYNSVARLVFKPSTFHIKIDRSGIKKDTSITVTAINEDFNISDIIISNPSFSITPNNFTLKKGQSRELTISYLPTDIGYNICEFHFSNNKCPVIYYASGGRVGIKSKTRTIKILNPNGNEKLIAGTDTIITWQGVKPDEIVKIEYSTNNGDKWITICDTAKGFSNKWRVPKTPSNKCLARITANSNSNDNCENQYVDICGNIWMGCNLDVVTYRNGDTIPEIKNHDDWQNATSGAWCYYNNDPALGAIYGKLYNWYAVTDPRGLAPNGWHIATAVDWINLENCLGGNDAGGKIKSKGTVEVGNGLWYSPNSGATNETGFNALPGGERHNNYSFEYLNYRAVFWTSTKNDQYSQFCIYIYHNSSTVQRVTSYGETKGYSVRCVLD